MFKGLKIKTLLRYVFWGSTVFIFFWVTIGLFGQLIPIEFTIPIAETNFYLFRFFGIPIAILLTLAGTIKTNDTKIYIGAKIFVTLLISVFSMLIMLVSMFGDMCSWRDGDLLLVNKNNKSLIIVDREQSCGAYDSGIPVYKTFKIQKVSKYFNIITEIDTNRLDMKQWKRIDKSNDK